MKIADPHALTGRKANEIVRHFVPIEEPVFIDNLGAWYAGGGYYKLWQREDDTKIITYSRSHEPNAPQFLVRAWPTDADVSNDESTDAITEHARHYRNLVLSTAVLKKTRFHDKGMDTYYSPHQFYQVEHKDKKVRRISKSMFVGDHGHVSPWHPRLVLWPREYSGLFGPPDINRKEAELIVCKDFVGSLRRALTSDLIIDPDLRTVSPAHFHIGRAKRVLERFKKKTIPSFERIEAGVSLRENAFALIEMAVDSPWRHLSTVLWKAFATVIAGRSIARRESEEKLPGCLRAADPLVKELSDESSYAYPLGGFLRPIKDGALRESNDLGEPVFGKETLFKHIRRIPDFAHDGMHGFSEAYLGPTIGSTVRFYWDPHREQKRDPAHNVGAIKIFRPDGLTVTIFEKQTRVWVSFEPERNFEDGISSLPVSIMAELAKGSIVELSRSEHGARVKSLSFAEADLVFRKKFGDAFRTPHRPDAVMNAPARAIAM